MKIKILRLADNILVDALIKDGKNKNLPSFHQGWRFNFLKHAKSKEAQVYILVAEETPTAIEGCLIYKMKQNIEPYMAFVEIAPTNKGIDKKYDWVAACLIAYACRLSFVFGKGDYKGWLAFDVMEESKEDENKLMAMYSNKYGAVRLGSSTTMIIQPEDGEKLIDTYLNNI